MNDIFTLEKSSTLVDVTLHKNSLKNDESYFGIVDKNKVTFNNILAEIAKNNKGIDPHLVQYAGIIIQKEIINMLKQGKTVNVLDLVTINPKIKCNVKNKNEVKSKSSITIKVSPTKFVKEAVSSIKVNNVVYHNPNPEIEQIIDLSTKKSISKLENVSLLKITGRKLKLGKNNSGIYFVKVDKNGNFLEKEFNWIKVEEENIFLNTPTELNFFVPNYLEFNANYKILIKTSYLKNGKTRKKAVFTSSKILNT